MTDAKALQKFREDVESASKAYRLGHTTVTHYTSHVLALALALTLHKE